MTEYRTYAKKTRTLLNLFWFLFGTLFGMLILYIFRG